MGEIYCTKCGREVPMNKTRCDCDEDDIACSDNVNHPSHYTSGKIEVIDFIEDQQLNYHKGNADFKRRKISQKG